ncbi:MAG: acyltransferase family protein [Paludibacter sp.]|jgi:fucose 4-O-acetylase-like acetyltransferase|nr:acyltransferase family protein [Paludibacter sp.]
MIKNQRIEFIDALKGFAILLAVWGHSLQCCSSTIRFFDNPVFVGIYSFHMPIFFVVSGFFFSSSLKLGVKDFLVKKFVQLILPCIVWQIIYYIAVFIEALATHNEAFLSGGLMHLWGIINPYCFPWFLREIFVSYVLAYFALKLLKKYHIAAILSILIVCIAPFLTEFQRFLFPFFWVGILLNNKQQIFFKHVKIISIVTGLLWAVSLLFWNGHYTIYETDFQKLFDIRHLNFDFTNIGIITFRFFIGLFGSMFWFGIFAIIYRKNRLYNILGKIGKRTLAIYLLSGYMFRFCIESIIDFSGFNQWIYTLILTPLFSIILTAVCMLIIGAVQKNSKLDLLLFGNQRKK